MLWASKSETAWSITDHLLASVLDTVRLANWQRGAKPGAPRPKPTPRPGVKDDNAETFGGVTTYTVEEMADLVARYSRGG